MSIPIESLMPGQQLLHELVLAMGWTLLHFCWEGALVEVMLWCVLGFLGDRSQARYIAACFALALMVAMPLVTFARIASAEYAARATLSGTVIVVDPGTLFVVGADAPMPPWPVRFAMAMDHAMPWLLAAWFAGVILFALRLSFGMRVARRLKSAGTEAPPPALQRAFDELRERLKVTRTVRLMHSALVEVPTVIGWLRPVVLIPVSCLTGLSAPQIEAILCHELAHVRRHDYLVSVFQSVVEALLFYHPAVWWVSKQVRRERECCCDELAVGMGGNRLAYARALSSLEEHRAGLPEFVLGANGGVLSMRIKRLLGCKENAAVAQVAAFTLMAIVLAAAGSYLVTVARAEARANKAAVSAHASVEGINTPALGEIEAKAPKPFSEIASAVGPMAQATGSDRTMEVVYRKWVDEDVRWIITPEERAAFLALANDEERDRFVENFWALRNPRGSPAGTFREEHYARIAYSNEHFADDRAGWTTDRGRVYIVNGKPQSIDSHPSGGQYQVPDGTWSTMPPFEVWHYQAVGGAGQKIDFRFVQDNSGQYRLAAPGSVAETQQPLLLPPGIQSPGQRMHLPIEMMNKQLISKVDPVYPEIAREAHVQGTVVLSATISKQGTVDNLQLISGTPMLVASTMDAVRQWTYRPFLMNGGPQDVDTSISITYRLAEDGTPTAGLSDTDPLRVASWVAAGSLISKVDPVYPAQAKAAGVQGAVVLKAIISNKGMVESLQVVSGPPALTGSALDAVRQWRYQPYLLNGEPAAVQTTVTVNFSLDGGTAVRSQPAVLNVSYRPQSAAPQTAATAAHGVGAIAGVIVDPTGALVPRAKVTATNTDTGVQTTASTDNTGSYSLSPLPSGPYNLEIVAAGFQRMLQENVKVVAGGKVGLNLKLTAGAVSQTLTVTGAPVAAVPQPPPTPAPVAAANGKPTGPQRVSSGMIAGNIISKVDPVYPDDVRAEHIQGTVVLLATISKAGTIEKVRAVSGPVELVVCSIDAVRQWKYKPFLLNGEPTEVQTTINIHYALDGSAGSVGENPGRVDANPPPPLMKDGATAPIPIYQVEPEFSAKARKAKKGGVVTVRMLVDKQGLPQNVHVVHGVGMGLDEKAVEAVKQYKFRPAKKDGQPVEEAINIEVNFKIF